MESHPRKVAISVINPETGAVWNVIHDYEEATHNTHVLDRIRLSNRAVRSVSGIEYNNWNSKFYSSIDTSSSEIKVAASQTASSDITFSSNKYHVLR